jgi:hypothetical protein
MKQKAFVEQMRQHQVHYRTPTSHVIDEIVNARDYKRVSQQTNLQNHIVIKTANRQTIKQTNKQTNYERKKQPRNKQNYKEERATENHTIFHTAISLFLPCFTR